MAFVHLVFLVVVCSVEDEDLRMPHVFAPVFLAVQMCTCTATVIVFSGLAS